METLRGASVVVDVAGWSEYVADSPSAEGRGGSKRGGSVRGGGGPCGRRKKERWKEEGSKEGEEEGEGSGKGVRSASTIERPGCCQYLPV